MVDTLCYINGCYHPVDKAFQFSWNTEEQHRTTWNKQWGSGKCYVYETEFPDSDISVRIVYNQMRNISITSVPLSVKKSLQVSIAPRKTAIIQLLLSVSEIVDLPFTATIKCIGANKNISEFKVEGSWSGTLHKISSSKININETEIGII